MAAYKNKKNGTWYIQCRNPQDTTKTTTIRRNPLTNQPFQEKKEALAFEREFIQNKVDIQMKFKELYEKYRAYKLMRNPYDVDLDSWYENHLKRFDKRKITSLRPADLNKLASDLLDKDYSINFTNKMISQMKTILNFAVSEGYLKENLCKNVKTIKKVKTNKTLKFWTPEEFKVALDSLPKVFNPKKADVQYISQLLRFGYYSSMRIGEIRALRWSDVDFDKNLLYINSHIVKLNREKEGRKNNDYHILYMDELLKDILLEIRARYEHLEAFNENAFVFPSLKKGLFKPMSANSGNKYMKRISQKTGLREITFHGIRHSSASWLISVVGLNVYQVADRLGDTVEVTLRVYAQFFNEAKKDSADAIDKFAGDIKEKFNVNYSAQQEGKHETSEDQ